MSHDKHDTSTPAGAPTELDTKVVEILADREKFKREVMAKARAENPQMTEEQLEVSWGLVEATFGL